MPPSQPEPKPSTLDGDTALQIIADVVTDTDPGKSRLTYDAAMKAFRKGVEKDLEDVKAMKAKGKKKVMLDIPSELPRSDIDISPPKKGGEKPKAEVKESDSDALFRSEIRRGILTLHEAGEDDHPYGPWFGGSRSAGGHPGGEDTEKRFKSKDGWDPKRAEEVHEPYFKSVTEGLPRSDEPTVYMTGGGPASGKTSGILENEGTAIPDKKRAAHIDPDGAKSHIPEYQQGVKSGYPGAAGYAHEESSYMAKAATARALQGGHDVVYDSVGDSGIDKLHEKVQTMRAQGAKRVVADYATVPVATALQRNADRAAKTGRLVPPAYVEHAYRDVPKTVQGAISRNTFDRMRVWDTSGDKPKLLATHEKGKLTVHDQAGWKAFIDSGG